MDTVEPIRLGNPFCIKCLVRPVTRQIAKKILAGLFAGQCLSTGFIRPGSNEIVGYPHQQRRVPRCLHRHDGAGDDLPAAEARREIREMKWVKLCSSKPAIKDVHYSWERPPTYLSTTTVAGNGIIYPTYL